MRYYGQKKQIKNERRKKNVKFVKDIEDEWKQTQRHVIGSESGCHRIKCR